MTPSSATPPAGGGDIGLVLVTHGSLAEALLDAMQHIVGPQAGVAAIGIGPDDDVETRRAEILAALNRVDGGSGAIVMTDMFGGTPSNLAISIMDRAKVEVIAGINLPMLVKLASVRDKMGMTEAVAKAQEAGKKYINIASQLLAKDKS